MALSLAWALLSRELKELLLTNWPLSLTCRQLWYDPDHIRPEKVMTLIALPTLILHPLRVVRFESTGASFNFYLSCKEYPIVMAQFRRVYMNSIAMSAATSAVSRDLRSHTQISQSHDSAHDNYFPSSQRDVKAHLSGLPIC